jgi:hypothetical protein
MIHTPETSMHNQTTSAAGCTFDTSNGFVKKVAAAGPADEKANPSTPSLPYVLETVSGADAGRSLWYRCNEPPPTATGSLTIDMLRNIFQRGALPSGSSFVYLYLFLLLEEWERRI